MGTAIRGLFKNRWHPQLQLVRWKTKVNVTRPRPPHFDRALLEEVCKPFFKERRRPKHVPDSEGCVAQYKEPKPELVHPLKTIYMKEAIDLFSQSRMAAIFHMNNIYAEEVFQCKLTLKKNGMKFMVFSKEVLQPALRGTIYEPILPLYNAPTATAFSPEADIPKIIAIHKKLPKLVLIAGIVDKKFLSLSELHKYSKFQDITETRLMLLQTLNSTSQNIVQQINHHPNNLVALLKQHKEILEGK